MAESVGFEPSGTRDDDGEDIWTLADRGPAGVKFD